MGVGSLKFYLSVLAAFSEAMGLTHRKLTMQMKNESAHKHGVMVFFAPSIWYPEIN